MRLFKIEWKKAWKKNHIGLFFILIVISSAVYFVVTFNQTNPSQENYISYLSLSGGGTNQPSPFEAETDMVENGVFDLTDETIIQTILNGLNDPFNDPMGIHIINHSVGENPNDLDYSWQISQTTASANTYIMRYLRDNKIEPRYPLRIQFSQEDRARVFDLAEPYSGTEYERATSFVRHRESRFDKGWYIIWQLLIDHLNLIFIVLSVLLFGGLLSSEQTRKRNHLSLLVVEGVNKPLLYLVKLMVAMLSSVVLIGSSVLAFLLTSLFFNGTGSLRYPVLFHFFLEESYIIPDYLSTPYVYDGQFALASISLGRYLFQAFILMGLTLLFIFSVCWILSQIIKQEFIVTIIGVGIIGLSYFLPLFVNSPFTYFSVHSVVSGNIRLIDETNHLSFYTGVRVLAIWSIILIIFGMIVYSINWKKIVYLMKEER